MMKPTLFLSVLILGMSSLTWARPETGHAGGKISKQQIIEEFKQLQKEMAARPAAPSKAQTKLAELFEWSKKVSDKAELNKLYEAAAPELDKLDGNALFESFVGTSRDVIARIDAYLLEREKVMDMKKKPFDLEVDLALVDEALFLRRMRRIVAGLVKPNLAEIVKDPRNKLLFTELLIRMNQDRVLLGYGKEMLKVSADPLLQGKSDATKRFIALRMLQQTELERPDIMKNFVNEVKGGKIYNANFRTDLNRSAFETFFDVKKGEANADTLLLGQELLFERHVPTIIDTYNKLPKEETKAK